MLEHYKYRFAKKYLKLDNDTVLEIGIGNDAPREFKRIFPNVKYEGVDKTSDYNLSDESKKLIDKFYKTDLEKENLDNIPDNRYKYVLITHVIEHIENGENVIGELTRKVKSGGGIYIEYPRRESARFPSMKGTLNFYDDPTHKRFYDLKTLEEILTEENFKIVKSGVKRDYARIVGIPYMAVKSVVKLGYLRGSIFWDLLGFAEFIFAVKK